MQQKSATKGKPNSKPNSSKNRTEDAGAFLSQPPAKTGTTVRTITRSVPAKISKPTPQEIDDIRATKSVIQDTIKEVEGEIDHATMGFALLMVMVEEDAYRGPKMLTQTINRRFVDKDFIKKFTRGVEQHGLHNRSSNNAITIGVKRSYIKANSLKPLELGEYTNRVEWTTPARGDEKRTMVMYNGSHRIHYMQTQSKETDYLIDYLKIKRQVEAATGKSQKNDLRKELTEALEHLDEHGVWLVKFLDIDMIQNSKHHALIQHGLTSNVPFAHKTDTEDDGLTQILTILNSMPVKDHQTYIRQVVGRLSVESKSKIPRILADTQAYTTAMYFDRIPNLRSNTSSGGGMSIRHLLSWSPATGGLLAYMFDYCYQVLRFLASPIHPRLVPSIDKVETDTLHQGIDLAEARRTAIDTMLSHARDYESEGLLWQPLSEIYLNPWTNSSMRLSDATMDLFGANGEGEEDARKQWEGDTDKYWRNLNHQAVQQSTGIAADSEDVIEQFKCAMPNKLEWVRMEELFLEYHPFTKKLPIMNKYLFSAVQHLFYKDEKNLHLEVIILEVRQICFWVEPFLRLTLVQRGKRQWRNALEGLKCYVLERLHLGQEAVGEVFALIIHRRRTHLRTMQTTYTRLEAKDEIPKKLPKDSDLLDKGFGEQVTAIINQYRAQLAGQTSNQEGRPYTRPPPSSKINLTIGFSSDQRTMLEGLIAMMQVTNFPWENRESLKGVSQLIKALGPGILSIPRRRELLATEDGWSMRTELQAILTKNMAQGEWKWWDGINTKPEDAAQGNRTIIQALPNESVGNVAARAWVAPNLRQENAKRIQKREAEAIEPPTAEEEEGAEEEIQSTVVTEEEEEEEEEIEIISTTEEEEAYEAQALGGLKRPITVVEEDAEERRPNQRLRLDLDTSGSSGSSDSSD
ncbi:hypothetical protein F4604DRAFT_1686101 [Suillus subluteus]|nr:hypothetical protein F4604DRAFT_1686101 [Suillus subluteus]